VRPSGPDPALRGATVAYTDGACRGNPGPGGWAWAVPGGAWESGYDPATTNQRMEITAAYRALLVIEGPVHIVSDSTYVVNCFRDGWWKGWIDRGWKNSKKEPVANRDLWEPLIDLVNERDVTFAWVKGHSGDPMNDLVDRLAVAAALHEQGASGSVPPTEDELGPPDAPAPARPPAAAGAAVSAAGAGARARDGRVPEGTPWVVTGLRSEQLEGSRRGDLVRRQLVAPVEARSKARMPAKLSRAIRCGSLHQSTRRLNQADACR
jgi:ribonuclease HI